jgi:hypothetical protein
MPMTQHFSARTQDGKDVSAELQDFANGIGLEKAAPDRYSFLLVLGLFGSFKAGVLNPAKVVHEIRALEGIGPPSRLKPRYRTVIKNNWAADRGVMGLDLDNVL